MRVHKHGDRHPVEDGKVFLGYKYGERTWGAIGSLERNRTRMRRLMRKRQGSVKRVDITEEGRRVGEAYNRCRAMLRNVVVKGWCGEKAQELIGCGKEELLEWLDAEGEYGEDWELGFVVAAREFDLLTDEGRKEAFNYRNLKAVPK